MNDDIVAENVFATRVQTANELADPVMNQELSHLQFLTTYLVQMHV